MLLLIRKVKRFFRNLDAQVFLAVASTNFLCTTALLFANWIVEHDGDLASARASVIEEFQYWRIAIYLVVLAAAIAQCYSFVQSKQDDWRWQAELKSRVRLILFLATANMVLLVALILFILWLFSGFSLNFEALVEETMSSMRRDHGSFLAAVSSKDSLDFIIFVVFGAIFPTAASLGFIALFLESDTRGHTLLFYSGFIGFWIALEVSGIWADLDYRLRNFIAFQALSPIFFIIVAILPYFFLFTILRIPAAMIAASNSLDDASFRNDFSRNADNIRRNNPGMTYEQYARERRRGRDPGR